MNPARFDYVRAETVDEAIQLLVEHGAAARLLAGGHSLLPLMKLRRLSPEVVVDLAGVDELRGVSGLETGWLAIGAMTSHAELTRSAMIREHCGILAEVAERIGDPQVRNCGTIGGALAHGDAAGDLSAALVALEGAVLVQGPRGRREIAAGDFFIDHLRTAIGDNEVLLEVRVPRLDASWRWSYEKFTQVARSWAIVGSCCLVKRAHGSIEARVGLSHMAPVPIRASRTEQALTDALPATIAEAAALAADATDPPSDLAADADFRRHLARVLTHRALTAAMS